MSKPTGFLTVMMEPPPALEEEFSDWYDMEHVPERTAVSGFETATRFVCVDGWPRYLAFYDLRDVSVINEPGYQAISGSNFSPWSKRILSRVRGLYRSYGEQVYPGRTMTGPMTQLLLIRFRNIAIADEKELVKFVMRVFERQAGVRQVRVVRDLANAAGEYLALVEMTSALAGSALDLEEHGQFAAHIDIINAYVPYWARGPVPGVFTK